MEGDLFIRQRPKRVDAIGLQLGPEVEPQGIQLVRDLLNDAGRNAPRVVPVSVFARERVQGEGDQRKD